MSRSYANSAQADYSPVIYEDDYIVFTSDRGGSTGDGRYNWTGNKFSDFYLMSKNGAAIQPFDPIINSEHNEGTIAFSKDYNELFFTRCYSESTEDAYCKVMYSDRYDGYWTEPIALPFNKPGMNYGHPTLIENDSVLIYTAKIDNTVSDYDLFYVIRELDGAWSEPQRMPDVLNTKGNEKFPTGHGDTLFFSSDHHPGLGGLDIFMTYLDKNRKWVRPIRMPVPINSPADDFSFVVDKKSTRNGDVLETGFFSSSRTGIGDDDIYTYKKVVVEKTDKEVPEVVIDEPVVERNISYYIAGKVVEPIYEENNNPNTNIIGYRPVDFARVRINQDSSIIGTFTTDRTGVFIEELESESDYNIYAGKNRYLNNSMDVTTRNITIDSAQDVVTLNVQLVINRVFKGKEINLSDIYYDLDKDFIREDAKPTLDKLVKILTDNPDIRLQLSSHTDCRAEDQYNIDLSQRRAISAVKYIISKGVIQKRLVPKGYGETQLAVDCECEKCTEEEHQTNRRTTFKIIS